MKKVLFLCLLFCNIAFACDGIQEFSPQSYPADTRSIDVFSEINLAVGIAISFQEQFRLGLLQGDFDTIMRLGLPFVLARTESGNFQVKYHDCLSLVINDLWGCSHDQEKIRWCPSGAMDPRTFEPIQRIQCYVADAPEQRHFEHAPYLTITSHFLDRQPRSDLGRYVAFYYELGRQFLGETESCKCFMRAMSCLAHVAGMGNQCNEPEVILAHNLVADVIKDSSPANINRLLDVRKRNTMVAVVPNNQGQQEASMIVDGESDDDAPAKKRMRKKLPSDDTFSELL